MPTKFPHYPVTLVELASFKTDVQLTRDGEDRTSLKAGDYGMKATFTVLHAEAARMEGLYRSDPYADFYVPLWQDTTLVETTIASGATSIAVDTDAGYVDGGYALVSLTDEVSEIVTVTTATGGTLTCSALSREYPATASDPVRVCPCVIGYMAGGMQRSDQIATSDINVEFRCPDAQAIEASIFPTYLTYDVVTSDAIVWNGLDAGLAQQLTEFMGGHGGSDLIEGETYPRRRGVVSVFDTTQPERWATRTWIHRLRGRDRPFWVATGTNDLPLRTAAASGAVSIRVQRTTPVEADLVGRSIQIRTPAGDVVQRQITAAAAVGGDDTSVDLTIAAPGVDLPTSTILSFLHLSRLDTDEIETQHVMGGNGILSKLQAATIEVLA